MLGAPVYWCVCGILQYNIIGVYVGCSSILVCMLDTQYTGPICFYCSIVTFNSFGAAIVVEALQAVSCHPV